jgi:hypothetical protein
VIYDLSNCKTLSRKVTGRQTKINAALNARIKKGVLVATKDVEEVPVASGELREFMVKNADSTKTYFVSEVSKMQSFRSIFLLH